MNTSRIYPMTSAEELWMECDEGATVNLCWPSMSDFASASRWPGDAMDNHQDLMREHGTELCADWSLLPVGDLPGASKSHHAIDGGIRYQHHDLTRPGVGQSVDQTKLWAQAVRGAMAPQPKNNPLFESNTEYSMVNPCRSESFFPIEDIGIASNGPSFPNHTIPSVEHVAPLLHFARTDTSPGSTYSTISGADPLPLERLPDDRLGSEVLSTDRSFLDDGTTWNIGGDDDKILLSYDSLQPSIPPIDTTQPTLFDPSLMGLSLEADQNSGLGYPSTVSPSSLNVFPHPSPLGHGREPPIATANAHVGSIFDTSWPSVEQYPTVPNDSASIPATGTPAKPELLQCPEISSGPTKTRPTPDSSPHQESRTKRVAGRPRKRVRPRRDEKNLPKLHPRPVSGQGSECPARRSSRTRPGPTRTRRGTSARPPRKERRPNSQDLFLVESRLAGMSYKDIQEKGKFGEAESTLRGRFRTLTKRKESRVRKPEWEEEDIRLLIEGVRAIKPAGAFGEPDRFISKSEKIPWKRVADYIVKNGGSYHFGNATCSKKWVEINGMAM